MAEKIKKASPYFLILVFVGLIIAFNFWSSLDKNLWDKFVKAYDEEVGSSVTVGNTAPTIKGVNLYGTGMTTITMTEGTGIDLMASVEVEDANGCTDIREGNLDVWFVTTSDSTAGVAWWDHANTGGDDTTCSYDPNVCYDNSVVSCSFASCDGNTATYYCLNTTSLSWKYYADPTGTGSSHSEDAWVVIAYVSDSAGNDDTSDSWAASDSANIDLLLGIDITQGGSDSIAYGSIAPNSTGKAAPQIGITNSGNQGVDPIIEELTSMSLNGAGVTFINTARQQYANFDLTVTDDLSAIAGGASLSGDNLTFALGLCLPQRGRGENDDDPWSSISDDQLYFGIDIPYGQTPGEYLGSISYTATAG